MRTATVLRGPSTDAGTFGDMKLDDGTAYKTGELPWRNDQPRISSIPPGVYVCKWLLSPKHGWCYHITGVPDGRSEIEIHSANWMGDTTVTNPATGEPYLCQLEGCMALGHSVGLLERQMAVLMSADAVRDFNQRLNAEDLELTIAITAPPPVPIAVDPEISV